MDPKSGRLYESTEAARQAGVRNPVEVSGGGDAIAELSARTKLASHMLTGKATGDPAAFVDDAKRKGPPQDAAHVGRRT